MAASHSQPKFSTDTAIAFYRNGRGIFPCILIRPIWQGKEWSYKVTTANGNQVTKRESELLTGWESDFPAWSQVTWGNFNPRNYENPPEWEDDSPALEEWEPDDGYYSELAEVYE